MSRLSLEEICLMNLEGRFNRARDTRWYLTPEEAMGNLKRLTGEDFGLDAARWRQWLKRRGKLRNLMGAAR